MSSATYQTKVPSTLVPYCEAMGFLFGQAERHPYSSLSRGEKLNTLKKEYQIRFGINARQFNSVHSSIKGKIESRKQCHKRLLNELTGQIRINLNDRSTQQVEATLGDAVKQLVEIASNYGCPIAVEQLDFSKKKASMKQQGVRYSRMLSNFSQASVVALLLAGEIPAR